GGFRVIDVSNPARPRELTWISITGNAYAVAISGSYAYVTGGPSSIFSVVDIQNPAAPSVVGSCYTAAGPDFNVAVSGSYAYVSDGLNNVGIWVIDVSNPTAPAVVGNCPLLGWGAGIAVSGSYAYVAAYQTYPALRVVDVSDPSQPFEAGYYVTVAPKDPAVSGQYIYLAEGAYFGIYQFSLPNVTITLVPIISPIQIPINGGSFDFYLFADNGGQGTQTVDLWTKAVLPGGSVMSPIMGSVSVSLNPGTTAWYRQQYIPARAPSGLYTYIACAGDYPDSIWASDSLQFTKLATGDGPWVGDWNCTGEENSTAEPFITHKSALITSIMPNPFNPTTAISFELRDASFVNLRIFDTAGRLVAELVNGWREAGSHEVTFDGSALPSGIYLARLTAGDYSRVQKLALLK
ncbi:MAG TPA: T9SS type A sorting domain-containing protein, partial [bacterium]